MLNEVVAAPGRVRVWGDVPPRNVEVIKRELDAQRQTGNFNPFNTINYLAISGGGSDGAFGAGLLVGWSESGSRPRFDVVTGISTGAHRTLCVSWVRLRRSIEGGLYDLRQKRPCAEQAIALCGYRCVDCEQRADGRPHRALRVVRNPGCRCERTPEGQEIADWHNDLDAQRPDMGAIAARADQNAIELFRKVILASVSVPGIFPPVLISVAQGGRSYDEMHVDGGVISQVFLFPAQFGPRSLDKRLGRSPGRRLFVIRNGRLGAEWETVESSLLKIAERSLSSLIKYQGRGDLDRMYVESRRYNVELILLQFQIHSPTKSPLRLT
jgi:hypothetical protein